MQKKPVVAFYGIWPNMKDFVRTHMTGASCHIHEEPLTEQNIQSDATIIATFIESPITKELMAKMPDLQLIATMSTGYDHIDVKTAHKRRITVCNVPSYGENTVAEHAMALILGLTRKMFASVKRVKEGMFDYHTLCGTDLKGKTLGVVGTGRIGQHLIKMAKAFDMTVIAYDPYKNPKAAKELGFTYTTLDKVLQKSDIISLHVPLLKTTYHLINKTAIKKMKAGAYIINTARGGLIDAEALLGALETRAIAGAGLDVLEDECYIQFEENLLLKKRSPKQIKTNLMNNLLIDHPNVIVTPHNAFNSTEALQRIVDTTILNIHTHLKGKTVNEVK